MKTTPEMRRILLAGLAAAALIAGCGQPGSRQINPVAASAERAEAQSSAYMHMEMTTGYAGTEFTIVGDGASDLERDRGYMNIKADLPGSEAGAAALQRMRTVYSGDLIYMRSSAFAAQLPPGKTWLRLDLEALGQKAGLDYGLLSQLGETDPARMLEFLRAVSDGIEEAGTEDVRGVATTHYRGVISLDRLAEELGEAGEPFIERLHQMGLESIPVEVWIDDEGLPRRMLYTVTFSQQEASTGATSEVLLEIFDYGEDVTVRIPPARKVADGSELF